MTLLLSPLDGFFLPCAVPKVKFTMYFAAHVAYFFFLVCVLIMRNIVNGGEPAWSDWMGREGRLTRNVPDGEWCLWAWTIARALGELQEVRTSRGIWAGVKDYWRDLWNKLDVSVTVFMMSTMCIRLVCSSEDGASSHACAPEDGRTPIAHQLSLCGYALIIILVSIRTLQYFRYFESIGVLIIVFVSMISDVTVFLLLIIIFSLGFGYAFAVLLPGEATNPFFFIFSTEPLWSPFWSLYGSDNLHNIIEEYIPYDASILRAFVPTLLWLYMLLATIVLVNLLIAQMSRTYDDVMQDSKMRWQYARAEIILEFKDSKAPLPPPLNIVWVLIYDLPRALCKACGWDTQQTWTGFKLIRPVEGPGLTQAILQRQEYDAMQRCVLVSEAKAKASVESRVSAKVTAALAEAADENMTRFEDLTGKLDQLEKMFEQNNQIVEQRLSRVLAALDAGSSRPPWIEVPASVSSEAPKMARRRRRVSREGPATPSQEDTTPGSCNSARMRFSSPTGSDGSEAEVGADLSYRV